MRRYRRDTGLSLRIALSLAGLFLMYVPLAVWLLSFVWVLGGIGGVATAACVLALGLLLGPLWAGRAGFAGAGRPTTRDEDHGLGGVVERLCAMADLPVPALEVLDVALPNAFTVGRTLVVTRGLLDRLNPEELEAVVAHELAHVANRDGYVMLIVSFPARALRAVTMSFARLPLRNPLIWLFLLYLVPVMVAAWAAAALAALLVMTLSRYRELVADRGSALLTGRPEMLMSALQKISAGLGEIPRTDLRAAAGLNPFFVMPTSRMPDGVDLDPFVLFPTHPTLARRLEQLSALARTQGQGIERSAPPLVVDEPPRPRNPRAKLAFQLALVTWPLGWGVPYLLGDGVGLAILLGMLTWIASFVCALQAVGRAERGATGGRLAAAALFILAAPIVFSFVGFAVIALVG